MENQSEILEIFGSRGVLRKLINLMRALYKGSEGCLTGYVLSPLLFNILVGRRKRKWIGHIIRKSHDNINSLGIPRETEKEVELQIRGAEKILRTQVIPERKSKFWP